MAIKPEILDALVSAGATAEMIVAAVKADTALTAPVLEERRSSGAARQARYRAKRWRLPEHLWRPLSDQVYARDGMTCRYCGDEHGPFSIDHIHPVCRGGSHDLENLAVACMPCNQSKGSKTLAEWRG